ncbi:MAG: T9SS type A sorting domain-containing protein [Bacteroidota bacterium]
MYRLFLIIGLIFVGSLGKSQTIDRFEYFFDNDPGYGQGGSLSVTLPSNQPEESYVIPTSGLTPGFHVLYLRAYNPDSQRWSHTLSRAVYLFPSQTDKHLTNLEYFVDVDPGFGLGTSIPIDSVDSSIDINYLVNLSSIEPGAHELFIRSKNERGEWSFINKQAFCVAPGGSLDSLIRIEYRYTHTSGISQIFNYTLPNPFPSIELDFVADTSFLKSSGPYTICAQVYTQQGKYSTKGCSDFNFLGGPNSISHSEKWVFTLYPNPSNGIVKISLHEKPKINVTASVIAPQGGEVKKFILQDQSNEVDLSGLSRGLYLIVLQDGAKVFSKPLLIR